MRISRLIAAAALAAGALGEATTLRAQGVTTASIAGVVTNETGMGVENVQIQVTNQSTGFTTGTLSRQDGRYTVHGLEVGGPYLVAARQVGYTPEQREGLILTLGQVGRVDFQLRAAAVELSAVTVTADPVFNAARTGTGTLVSDSALRRLPTLNRNFTDFVALTPQVSQAGPGLSGGGVNNRYNSIQIDGTNSSDLFGLGSTGQPGGQADAKSISLEAVKEYQVLLTPFDVRQGNFAGALINAVTKGGTNDFKATAFYYTRSNEERLGIPLTRDVDFLSDYEKSQFGFSLGGPIIKDKLHFFVAPEWQDEASPASGPYVGQPADATPPVPVSAANLARFETALRGFGMDPGSAGFFNRQNPNHNVFGRIDYQLPRSSRMVLTHNYVFATDDVFSRTGDFLYTSNAYFFQSTTNKPALQVYTNFANGAYNEFSTNYTWIRDRRTPRVQAPAVFVAAPGRTVVAGADRFSMGNELDQDLFEIKDDFSFNLTSNHRLTLGTQNQFFKIRNLFNRDSYGVYYFQSLDSLEAGRPRGYDVSKDLGGGIPVHMKAAQYGVYAQDQWQVTPQFALQLGLRADIPVLKSKPRLNQRVLTAFGRRTDEVPSGTIHWEPRVSFNWSLPSTVRSQLRGGVGVFMGRPPYVWLSNAYQNSGTGLGLFVCGRTHTGTIRNTRNPESFETDPSPAAQPDRCAGDTLSFVEAFNRGVGSIDLIDLVDKDLKFPQTLRATLGFDRELPRIGLLTLEGLYTRGINDLFYLNRNLAGPVGTDRRGRVMYGTISGTGAVTVARRVTGFGDVIEATNTSKNYAYNVTAQLQRRFSENLEASAAYTFSRARDVQSPTSSQGISNWRFGRTLTGRHDDESVSISLFDQPHKVVVTALYSVPRTRTDISVFYVGQSGQPLDLVYNNFDANADGVTAGDDDLIYVPLSARDTAQIRFSQFTRTVAGVLDTVTVAEQAEALERFINGLDCLNDQRGMLMARNSCRSPWTNRLDMSIRQRLPEIRGNQLAVQLDIFNVLNLLNKDWGQAKTTGGFSNVRFFRSGAAQSSADPATRQPIVQYDPAFTLFNSRNAASVYQLQLALRYSFY